MNVLKISTSIALSLVLGLMLAVSAVAQQKRQGPAKPQPQKGPVVPAPPRTPPPTFDTLLAAGSYRVYGEVRSVGQLIRSNSVNEILEPILKLGGPPKEFRAIVKWLNLHADEVMTSRMLAAFWSTKDMPSVLVAIEFASAEEAAKFDPQLKEFLPQLLPSAEPNSPAETKTGPTRSANQAAPPPPPLYHIQQAGSLILITSTKLDLKKLRPAGSKLLTEDINFRMARNRFNAESIFIYVDVDGIEKEEQEQAQQRVEAERKLEEAAQARNKQLKVASESAGLQTVPPTVPENPPPPELPPTPVESGAEPNPNSGAIFGISEEARQPTQAVTTLLTLGSALSSGQAKWPAGVGIAISLEGESFDVRALMVNTPGEKSDPIPFFPVLAPGPAITPGSPSVLPADTEMLLTMSLDFPQIYATLSKPPPADLIVRGVVPAKVAEFEPPYAAIEKSLNIKIKDDLLPLLGSEIGVILPLTGLDLPKPPGAPVSEQPEPKPDAKETAKDEPQTTGSLAVAISLRDKEGMRALLPKIVETLAFKGASAFAQVERRGDTELVSYAKILSYAFIGDFLVISPDAATTKHIVDSYLKGETLASEVQFKNYTRWHPQQLQGQVYISPALMENYRKWVNEPNTKIDEQTRSFLARVSLVAQPVTYSFSNEGFGPLHELHLPKNLVLMFIAGAAGATGGN